jgi:superfamily II DNA or RNA helicase
LTFDLWSDWGDPPGDTKRWYQRECKDACFLEWQTCNSLLVVAATGTGKSVIAADIAESTEGPVLVLANRDELVDQMRGHLEKATGTYVEIEQGDLRASARARYVVGSVQSFHKRRLESMGKDRFALVIADEADLFVAPTYRRAFEYFNAKKLGITATADRGDGKALGLIFDRVAYEYDILTAIDDGHLVPIVGRHVEVKEIDLKRVGKTKGDFVEGELDEEMARSVKPIVLATLEHEPNRKGIAFFPGVRSAELAAAEFNLQRPGSAAFVSGETPHWERKQIFADFRSGKLQFVCNCNIATRGFDAPATDLVIMARPTLSRTLFSQMVGRGTRVLPGIIEHLTERDQASTRRGLVAVSGKPACTVLDFVRNSERHSLVGVEDLLGGRYSDAERKVAKKKREEGDTRDTRDILKDSKAELEKLAKSYSAKVKTVVRPFDPFHILGMDRERLGVTGHKKPISPRQREVLIKIGVSAVALKTMSYKEASAVLDEMNERRKKGFCTFGQMNKLQEFGVTNKEVSFERAREALDYIAAARWRPDPHRLQDIIFAGRQPGE